MVRVRQQNGDTVAVDKAEAVEILGLDRRLAAVVIQDHRGAIHVAFPGEPLFNAYTRVHVVPAAHVHKHDAPVTV